MTWLYSEVAVVVPTTQVILFPPIAPSLERILLSSLLVIFSGLPFRSLFPFTSLAFLTLEHFCCFLHLHHRQVPLTVSVFAITVCVCWGRGGRSTGCWGHMWRPEVDIRSMRCLLQLLSIISHWTRNLHIQVDWLDRMALESACSAEDAHGHPSLLRGAGIRTQALTLAHSHFIHRAVALALFSSLLLFHLILSSSSLSSFPPSSSSSFKCFLLYFVLVFKYIISNCCFVFIHNRVFSNNFYCCGNFLVSNLQFLIVVLKMSLAFCLLASEQVNPCSAVWVYL